MDAEPDDPVSLPSAAQSPVLPADSEELTVRLHHQHLPMLTAHQYVEWTHEPFQASRGDNFDELAQILESLYTNADSLPDDLVHGCSRLEHERSDLE
ncbi:hypothetical protein ACLI4Q_00935 [Natrialbaceae archaeon A-CW1-1]